MMGKWIEVKRAEPRDSRWPHRPEGHAFDHLFSSFILLLFFSDLQFFSFIVGLESVTVFLLWLPLTDALAEASWAPTISALLSFCISRSALSLSFPSLTLHSPSPSFSFSPTHYLKTNELSRFTHCITMAMMTHLSKIEFLLWSLMKNTLHVSLSHHRQINRLISSSLFEILE